jgi:hypothetical protein
MFKKIAKSEITAEEIKNRILAYASLEAAREVRDDNVWSGNIQTYTLCLRLSGIFGEKQFTDVLSSNTDTQFNSSKYVYLPNQVFLQDTINLDNRNFVQKMYRSFLRREADDGGLLGNVQQLNNGAPRENLVIGIRRSGEADNIFLRVTDCLDDETFFDIAQEVYLNNEYPQDKRQKDLQALNQGSSRREVFESLKQFQELKTVLDNLKGDFYQEDQVFIANSREFSDTDFVKTLYLTFLKRDADEGGLAGKVSQLAEGVARQDILYAVRTSGEAAQIFVNLTAGLNDQAFVEIAYRAYLKQSLSSQDKAAQLAALSQGKSRQEVLISSSI